jgi:hypothetical protein
MGSSRNTPRRSRDFKYFDGKTSQFASKDVDPQRTVETFNTFAPTDSLKRLVTSSKMRVLQTFEDGADFEYIVFYAEGITPKIVSFEVG